MIPMIQIIALVFLPALPITSTTPWHEERIELIEEEPDLEDIEKQLTRKRLRIMEINPEDAPQ